MKLIIALLMAVVLAACTGNPPIPQTPDQSVAAAEVTITAAYRTVADLEASKSLTKEQAGRLIDLLHKADAQLPIAKATLVKGIPADTTQQLILLQSLLLKYQQALQAEQGSK